MTSQYACGKIKTFSLSVATYICDFELLKTTERICANLQISDCIVKYVKDMLGVDLADWKTQNTELASNAKRGIFLFFLILWMLPLSTPT